MMSAHASIIFKLQNHGRCNENDEKARETMRGVERSDIDGSMCSITDGATL